MRNLLRLHEAIAVILLAKPSRQSTFAIIAKEINKRKLFEKRKAGITLEEQIRLRTSISSSKYKYMFEFEKPDKLKLK